MTTRAYTVAFQGVEARQVEVQCAVAPGLPAFSVVFDMHTLSYNIVLPKYLALYLLPQLGNLHCWLFSKNPMQKTGFRFSLPFSLNQR